MCEVTFVDDDVLRIQGLMAWGGGRPGRRVEEGWTGGRAKTTLE